MLVPRRPGHENWSLECRLSRGNLRHLISKAYLFPPLYSTCFPLLLLTPCQSSCVVLYLYTRVYNSFRNKRYHKPDITMCTVLRLGVEADVVYSLKLSFCAIDIFLRIYWRVEDFFFAFWSSGIVFWESRKGRGKGLGFWRE